MGWLTGRGGTGSTEEARKNNLGRSWELGLKPPERLQCKHNLGMSMSAQDSCCQQLFKKWHPGKKQLLTNETFRPGYLVAHNFDAVLAVIVSSVEEIVFARFHQETYKQTHSKTPTPTREIQAQGLKCLSSYTSGS